MEISQMFIIVILLGLSLGLYLYTQCVKDQVLFFYHPSCGHCIEFKPAWEEVKKQIDMPCKDINCQDNPEKCSSYGIEGYPTILVEKNGKKYEFKDKRTVENVVSFINNI